mmetsp:Transcript_47125/g.127121  ORF Transcript_47125/g.127121 Transcript_47125/m.127121 type:complete len:720 (+) Transcript_47125:76-2235(+)
MKFSRRPAHVLSLLALLQCPSRSEPSTSDPLVKVLELMTKMQKRVRTDAETAEKVYRDYKLYCVDSASKLALEVKARQTSKDMLQATAQEASTDVEDARAKIQEITDQLAQNDQKLKDATAVRSEEEKEFQASESKLVDAADMLTRAIAALNKAAEGGGTSLAQQSFRSKGLKPVLVGLGAVIEAAEIRSTLPPERLTAMLQELEGAAKDAPGNDKPGSKSNTVIMVMEDMRGKAAEQLEKVRATEAEALHNFRLLKASVERSSANAGTELAEVKSEMSASQERLASTNGELRVVAKLLALAQDALKSSQSACIEAAADHEKSVHDVEAELAALGEAEKLLAEASGSTAYSLAQVSLARSHDGSAARISAAIGREVLGVVKRVASEQQSAQLSQLASRIAVLTHYKGMGGGNPFEKIRELISQMLEKLQAELSEEVQQKEWCDDEISKTTESNEDLGDKIEGIKSKVDQAISGSASLKEDTKEAQAELLSLANLRKRMDAMREEQKKAFEASSADYHQSMKSVMAAASVLKRYYTIEEDGSQALLQARSSGGSRQPQPPQRHAKSSSDGQKLIGLLEIVEADIANTLIDIETEEEDQVARYKRSVQENQISMAQKQKTVEHKSGQFKALDKATAEMSRDYSTASAELQARSEYLEQVKTKCQGAWAHETFEERKKKREAELKGLVEAQAVLQGGGPSFLQRRGGAGAAAGRQGGAEASQ